MEKILRPYDKEYMRMAMLKHEEIFRKQVYELHRLYSIQKIIMKDMESKRENGHNQDNWNSKNGNRFYQNIDLHAIDKKPQLYIDLEKPAEDYIAKSEGNGELEIEDESMIELTLGPACYYRRWNEERPITSDSGLSLCSSSNSSRHAKRTSLGLPLTTCMTIEESTGQNWGLVVVPDKRKEFANGGRGSSNAKEHLRQDELKQPLWLFKTLSLNMI